MEFTSAFGGQRESASSWWSKLRAPPPQHGRPVRPRAELWSSEALAYGGSGTPPLDTEENWRVPGHAAFALGRRRQQQQGSVR